MVELHRINGRGVFVNPDLIKQIDQTPDTIITFTDGNTLALTEKPTEIVQKIIEYRRKCNLIGSG